MFVIGSLSSFLHGDIQSFYDASSLLLVVSVALLAFVGFRRLGFVEALLRAAQILSLSVVPLGIEVFVFDRSEWQLAVTRFQVLYGVLPWFSNEDLLFVGIAGLAATTLLLRVFGKNGPRHIAG